MISITPECGTTTTGLGGFQETDQLTIFAKMTKYQGHVNNPARIAEFTGRAFDIALNERGPVQINIPRDFFYGENDFIIPQPHIIEKSARGLILPGIECGVDSVIPFNVLAQFDFNV